MKNKKTINDVVMVTREFGAPVFIAPLKNLSVQVTDKREGAERWSSEFDKTKLDFHKSATGYKELTFESFKN